MLCYLLQQTAWAKQDNFTENFFVAGKVIGCRQAPCFFVSKNAYCNSGFSIKQMLPAIATPCW
jgi:hypothetical protein